MAVAFSEHAGLEPIPPLQDASNLEEWDDALREHCEFWGYTGILEGTESGIGQDLKTKKTWTMSLLLGSIQPVMDQIRAAGWDAVARKDREPAALYKLVKSVVAKASRDSFPELRQKLGDLKLETGMFLMDLLAAFDDLTDRLAALGCTSSDSAKVLHLLCLMEPRYPKWCRTHRRAQEDGLLDWDSLLQNAVRLASKELEIPDVSGRSSHSHAQPRDVVYTSQLRPQLKEQYEARKIAQGRRAFSLAP